VLILRPIELRDLDDLMRLAGQLDSMNLPRDRDFLETRIGASLESFRGDLEPGTFVFVLEDCEAERCIGTSLILSKHGVPGNPYYWFELSTEERRSRELGKHFRHTKLRLRATEDGPSEIGGLILEPDYRGHPEKCGKALSVVRFAFMSMHPELFEREVIAEMLSPFEASGENLLWQAFGAHFTGLSYREADHRSARCKQFIADLFPQDPVYATLFPKRVQEAIGRPNETAKAAVRILEKVGFHYLNQVDPFDGGPYYGAARDAISSVALRREFVLPGESAPPDEDGEGSLALISAEGPLGFRATVLSLDEDGAPRVPKLSREALGVTAGDSVTVTPLP
jgi:arginine N-succinyltransferase